MDPPISIAGLRRLEWEGGGEGASREEKGVEEIGMGGVDGNGTGWAVDRGKWEEKMEKEGEIER
jgi:hypothetical protein